MMKIQTTLLVVEDNDLDVEKIERGLERLKISNPVRRAKNGLEALDILRGHGGHEQVVKPFIILLDLNMPKMNGIEFLQELRNDAQLVDSPVFVLTTSGHPTDIESAHQHNIAGYIVKPITKTQMFEALETLNMYWMLCEFPEENPT